MVKSFKPFSLINHPYIFFSNPSIQLMPTSTSYRFIRKEYINWKKETILHKRKTGTWITIKNNSIFQQCWIISYGAHNYNKKKHFWNLQTLFEFFQCLCLFHTPSISSFSALATLISPLGVRHYFFLILQFQPRINHEIRMNIKEFPFTKFK
jgi:hypothetical protein